jgi:DNA-binding LytR/AlgR family response regulator
MKIVIIEDEFPAAERLENLIKNIDTKVEVLSVLESVSSARTWFATHPLPDLIFADIQLSDGLSFEIFDSFPVHSPVIFTTSYDEYALKAFKVRSVDYLLKPLKPQELAAALDKFRDMHVPASREEYALKMESLVDTLLGSVKKYKTCFLVKFRDQLIPVQQKQISYFYYHKRLVCLVQRDGKQHLVDHTVEALSELLDPALFFQINRQFIVHILAVSRIHTHFNGSLKLQLAPKTEEEVIVSRDRTKAFKEWLERSV